MLLLAALVSLAVLPARAQQFTQQPGLLPPGPANQEWGEGVAFFDADLDGDLDLVLAQGDGFSSPGPKRQVRLWINRIDEAAGAFVDESAARIGTLLLNAKMVLAADLDQDGDDDLVLASAFQSLPVLLINDGGGNFTNETSTRLPAIALNSAGVAAADTDDDGDLDLGFMDAGPSLFGAPGGQSRLYRNDGNGFFTDVTATSFPSLLKRAQQDAQFADVDNDFDLDFLGIDRSSLGSHLFLNDGAGSFTDATAALPPQGGSVYEAEPSDLDGDGDLDLFYIGISGFNEGVGAGTLADTGTLGWIVSTAAVTGNQGDDDNEVAFLDVDQDGDLDACIGSLTNNSEKFFANDGTGQFSFLDGMITLVTDSTLDLAFGDIDADGDLDLFTCQGESGNFTDRLYRNAGPPDGRAPTFPRVEDLPNDDPGAAGPWVAHAMVSDGHYDDGVIWTEARILWDMDLDAGIFSGAADASYSGGGIFRGVLTDVSPGAVLDGGEIRYRFQATDRAGNVATSPETILGICGFANYGAGLAGTGGVPALSGSGTPSSGSLVSVGLSGAPAGAPGVLLVSLAPGATPSLGGTILVGATGLLGVPLAADAGGGFTLSFTMPVNPALDQVVLYWQAAVLDTGAPQGVAFTRGLRQVACHP